MMFGLPWKPGSQDKTSFGSCWLPINRMPAPPLPEGSRKFLLIIHEPGLGRESNEEAEKAKGELQKLGPLVPMIVARCTLNAKVVETTAAHFLEAVSEDS